MFSPNIHIYSNPKNKHETFQDILLLFVYLRDRKYIALNIWMKPFGKVKDDLRVLGLIFDIILLSKWSLWIHISWHLIDCTNQSYSSKTLLEHFCFYVPHIQHRALVSLWHIHEQHEHLRIILSHDLITFCISPFSNFVKHVLYPASYWHSWNFPPLLPPKHLKLSPKLPA